MSLVDFCGLSLLIPQMSSNLPPPIHQAAALEVFNALRAPLEAEPIEGTTGTNGAGKLFTAPYETGRGSRDKGGALSLIHI